MRIINVGVLALLTTTLVDCGGTAVQGPPVATQIAMNSGDGQTATVGTSVATPPSVIVKDANGSPVAGVSVAFSVTAGGGTISPTSAGTSDASGIAGVTMWALGPTPGSNSLTATAPGLAGSPVTFNATAQPISANVTIKVGNGAGLVFVPSQVTIPVGGTVTWQWNSGGISHNVSTSSGSPTVPGTPSATAATPNTFGPVTFALAGTYHFYCSVHSSATATSGMVGTIIVQ
jgi:plastocyanin